MSTVTAQILDGKATLQALVESPAERVCRGRALRTRAESLTWERNVGELMRLLAD